MLRIISAEFIGACSGDETVLVLFSSSVLCGLRFEVFLGVLTEEYLHSDISSYGFVDGWRVKLIKLVVSCLFLSILVVAELRAKKMVECLLKVGSYAEVLKIINQ